MAFRFLQSLFSSTSQPGKFDKVAADSPQVANSMTFEEIVMGKNHRVTALFVRFPSSELLPQPDFFKEAQRLLHSMR